jgi:hypothetical protein
MRNPIPGLNKGSSSSSYFFPEKPRIIARNTRIDINDPEESEMAAISKSLSVYDGYVSYPKVLWRAMVLRTENGKKILSVPRFVSKSSVLNNFPGTKINENSFTPFAKEDITNEIEPRSEMQRNALNYLFHGSNEFDWPSKIVDMPVGEGKTFVALKALSILKMRANIFIHKQTMIETPWIKDILKFTNIKREEIGIIQGYKSFEKIIAEKNKYKIFITLHRTFSSLTTENRAYENISRLYSECGIGINIIDEAHIELMSTFLISMYTMPKFSMYLTATLGRTEFNEEKIFTRTLPVKWSFMQSCPSETKRFVTFKRRNFKSNPSEKWNKIILSKKGIHIASYCDYLFENPEVYDTLLDIVKQSIREARKEYKGPSKEPVVAIILGKLSLVTAFIEDLGKEFGEENIGNFTGMIPIKERNKQLERSIIVSTEKSMDSAIDTRVDSIINCVPISSDVSLTQIIGRMRYDENHPNNPYSFYDVTDNCFSKSLSNSYTRANIIRKSIMLKEE